MPFADDVLLILNTVVGLQQQLNILRNAHKLNLLVNRDKSKINIFRNGGHVAAREKWLYDGIRLEVVNQCKYLGVVSQQASPFCMHSQTWLTGQERVFWAYLSFYGH